MIDSGLLRGFGTETVQLYQQWFPIANTGYLGRSFGEIAFKGIPPAPAPYANATHAMVVLVAYVAVFMAMSARLSRSRDVTS